MMYSYVHVCILLGVMKPLNTQQDCVVIDKMPNQPELHMAQDKECHRAYGTFCELMNTVCGNHNHYVNK